MNSAQIGAIAITIFMIGSIVGFSAFFNPSDTPPDTPPSDIPDTPTTLTYIADGTFLIFS